MEKLIKFTYENDVYTLYLENTKTNTSRIFVSSEYVDFEKDGIHYIAISDGNETFFYKYNVYCDYRDNKEKPIILEIPDNNDKKMQEMFVYFMELQGKVKSIELDDSLVEEDETKNINDENKNIIENAKTKKVFKLNRAIIIIADCLLFLLLTIAGYFFLDIIQINKKEANKESIIEKIEEIDKETNNKNNATIENSNVAQKPVAGLLDVSDIVKEIMPSVVSITSVSKETLYDFFYGYYDQESMSAGSGIIIGKNEKELLIATNSHVVAGSDDIKIYFSVAGEENKEVKANIKGTDEESDLAIVAVKLIDLSDDIIKNIKIASIGKSEELELGDPLIAIGNALGYGQSVTTGVVSALNRQIDKKGSFIQTDAAINPGNSGGALINAKGEVVGINCAKLADTDIEGIGYAIPSSVFLPILEDLSLLETKEKVNENEKGYLGILGTDVTKNVSEAYGMPMGVFISEIIVDGAASKSLLQPKDIIVKLNNTSITSMEKLQNELNYYKAGETIKLIVSRFVVDKYELIEIDIELGEKVENK